MVVVCSLINIAVNLARDPKSDNQLWTLLLASAISYLIPAPSMKHGT